MTGIQLFEEQLRIMTPHTYNALQKLVMSMAKVAKNANKKPYLAAIKGRRHILTFFLR